MAIPRLKTKTNDFIKRKALENSSENYMLGILGANDEGESLIDALDYRQVDITFSVLPLCSEPKPIQELTNDDNDYYIGVDSHQSVEFQPIEYDDTFSFVKRKEYLEKLLSNKLIVFFPYINPTKFPESYFKNLKIVKMLDYDLNDGFKYYVVPKVTMDYSAFEVKLIEGSYFNLTDYNGEMRESPEFILCGDFLIRNNYDDWENNPNNNRMWRCKDYTKIKRYYVKDHLDKNGSLFFKASETANLYFLNTNLAQKIQESGEFLAESEQEAPVKKVVLKDETQPVNQEVVLQTQKSDIVKDDHLNEMDFLRSFKKLTEHSNLIYKFEDLANLHICAKSNTITIIAGMSGTGKTQLALKYAEMLDLDEQNKTLLFMPISPSYNEPEDVLGYYSPTKNIYYPSSTGLVDFLIHAQDNPHKMHLAIFDEMNLAQIEYWFAPFLSLLERKPDERNLSLYISTDDGAINNYPPQIKVKDNVLFIGTINLDETTKDISDRLLDRSFVIQLSQQSFSKFMDKNQMNIIHNDEIEDYKCRDSASFDRWKKQIKNELFNENEYRFFDKVHTTISKFDSQKGVSFRALRNILQYIVNVPIDKDLSIFTRQDSFDLLFKQTILSKIKGSQSQLEELLGHYETNTNSLISGELQKVLNEFKEISHFRLSSLEIERKVRDLNQYGFTR